MDDPVQAQVDAYNARDIDAFMACYAPETVIRTAAGERLFGDFDGIRQRYAALFANTPDLHADIAGRVRAGEWTVDEERVSMGETDLHVLVGYRVSDGLIREVVMFR